MNVAVLVALKIAQDRNRAASRRRRREREEERRKRNAPDNSSSRYSSKEYSETEAFALTKDSEETSRVYGENKLSECSVIPVILAHKKNLNIQQ